MKHANQFPSSNTQGNALAQIMVCHPKETKRFPMFSFTRHTKIRGFDLLAESGVFSSNPGKPRTCTNWLPTARFQKKCVKPDPVVRAPYPENKCRPLRIKQGIHPGPKEVSLKIVRWIEREAQIKPVDHNMFHYPKQPPSLLIWI